MVLFGKYYALSQDILGHSENWRVSGKWSGFEFGALVSMQVTILLPV